MSHSCSRALWRPGWNTLRARITGNPPHITTWLNGERVVDFQDTERRLPARGAIALQVHGGDHHNTGVVRFRNIRAVRLDEGFVPILLPADACSWASSRNVSACV